MIRRAALAAIAFWVLALAALAGDGAGDFGRLDKGLEAYRRVDYAAALGAWLALAKRGDARAQTWIGVMHAEGKGVARDFSQAIRWFARAAAQGYGEAEFRLGVIHEFGHGRAADKTRALRYYGQAANHGHVEAQIRLSELYELGFGTAVDLVRAYMWAEIATRITGSHSQRVRAAGNRDTVAEIMTPDQAAEATRRVEAWLARRARRHGSSDARAGG